MQSVIFVFSALLAFCRFGATEPPPYKRGFAPSTIVDFGSFNGNGGSDRFGVAAATSQESFGDYYGQGRGNPANAAAWNQKFQATAPVAYKKPYHPFKGQAGAGSTSYINVVHGSQGSVSPKRTPVFYKGKNPGFGGSSSSYIPTYTAKDYVKGFEPFSEGYGSSNEDEAVGSYSHRDAAYAATNSKFRSPAYPSFGGSSSGSSGAAFSTNNVNMYSGRGENGRPAFPRQTQATYRGPAAKASFPGFGDDDDRIFPGTKRGGGGGGVSVGGKGGRGGSPSQDEEEFDVPDESQFDASNNQGFKVQSSYSAAGYKR